MDKKERTKRASGGTRAPTLLDVATEAGVSTVAVSVVLNGSRTGTRVSPATRERIMEAAAALHYIPNAVAQSLRKRRTNIIAFYNAQRTVYDARFAFMSVILAGVQEGCEQHGKDMLIHGTFMDRNDDEIYLGLLNGKIDGLVLYARNVSPLIERIVASHLPIVSVSEEIPGVPYVGVDEAQGSRMLAQHLASKGYKRVLYRRTNEVLPSTLRERFESFCEEAAALGMDVEHSLNSDFAPDENEKKLLLGKSGERPEVVVCWSDWSADGIVSFCQENGLRVPEDLAVVGFNGLFAMQRPALQLTTIQAPWLEVARTAVKILVDQCDGKDVPQRTVLPVELVVGGTTLK